jgi:NTE family protein
MGNWSLDASPGYVLMDHLSRLFSPYDLNPMDFNPLRDVVAACVDFDHVNDPSGLKLFLTATNVRTGKPKIFRQPAIGLDSIMASACLPFLFKAVKIDREAYWDGGYMGNPALFPLVDECDVGDIVVIQINPFYRPDIPRSAHDIRNRLNEITFNTSLLKELRSLAFLWEIIHYENLERERFRDVHVHAIHDEKTMLGLGVSSKLNAERAFLKHLRDSGRETAESWLARHYEDIGTRNTLDLSWIFEENLRPAHLPEGPNADPRSKRPPNCVPQRNPGSAMGLFEILLGLALLIWLAYRGWSILLLAPAAALIAAAFAGAAARLLDANFYPKSGSWLRLSAV